MKYNGIDSDTILVRLLSDEPTKALCTEAANILVAVEQRTNILVKLLREVADFPDEPQDRHAHDAWVEEYEKLLDRIRKEIRVPVPEHEIARR